MNNCGENWRVLIRGPDPADIFPFHPDRTDVPVADKGGKMLTDFFGGQVQGAGDGSGKGSGSISNPIFLNNSMAFQNFLADQSSQKTPVPMATQFLGILPAKGAILLQVQEVREIPPNSLPVPLNRFSQLLPGHGWRRGQRITLTIEFPIIRVDLNPPLL
jgi:hypothetical protein